MSRPTLVYILMLVAGACGLWLILRGGSDLVAPTDLSGVWMVGGEDPAQAMVLGETLHVEQSGRYVRLNFERGLEVDLKMVSEVRPNPGTGDGLDLVFHGPVYSLTAHGAEAAGPLIFHLESTDAQHRFTVTRSRAGEGEGDGDGDEAEDELASHGPRADAGTDAP